MKLRIGVDFDNTLIDYRELFYILATENGRNWLPAGHSPEKSKNKELIRQTLIAADGNDLRWQQLQAEAYGSRIAEAPAFEGVREFFETTRAAGHEIFVISHKTEFSKLAPKVSLRDAARSWLARSGLVIEERNIRFEPTQDAKVAALRELGCQVMVDDLRELLVRADFPPDTLPIWFAPQGASASTPLAFSSWPEILSFLGYCAGQNSPPLRAHPIENQGNSRLYRLSARDGSGSVLKKYPAPSRDFASCELLWNHGFRNIPEPLWQAPTGRLAVYREASGERPLLATTALVDQSIEFVKRLGVLSRGSQLPGVELAIDGRERLGDYLKTIEHRRARIEQDSRGRQFIDSRVAPLWNAVISKFHEGVKASGVSLDRPLKPEQRLLSPSDFGLHNMLVAAGGEATFLDFEYFGWDDPAKLVADYFHSVAQHVEWDLKWRFLDGVTQTFADPGGFLRRWELIVDLIGLEWVLIVLNVFEAEKMARKKFADPGIVEEELIRERIHRAEKMLKDFEICAARKGRFLTLPDRVTPANPALLT